MTDAGGGFVRRHDYYPFGQEVLPQNMMEPMRFTGHEKDFAGMGGEDKAGDLEYMHARYYSGFMGRFLSVDPVGGNPRNPQSWNRYAYVLNNPVKYVDPTGEVVSLGDLSESETNDLTDSLSDLIGNKYDIDDDGSLVVISYGKEASTTGTEFLDQLIGSAEVFTVKSVTGSGTLFGGNPEGTNTIQLDFGDFDQLSFGEVKPASFSLGSTFVHEAAHAALGLSDPSFANPSQPGAAVSFVNQIRQERGLPIRGPIYGGVSRGLLGRRLGINFLQVSAQRPKRIYYVEYPTALGKP